MSRKSPKIKRQKPKKEEYKDQSYWGQPLWYRIYCRVFYAIAAFLIVGSFFDIYTGAPLWMQIVVGGSVALAVLLFRMAYPEGMSGIYQWILEGMQEAAEDMEERGMKPNMSSDEIKGMLKQYTTEEGREQIMKEAAEMKVKRDQRKKDKKKK